MSGYSLLAGVLLYFFLLRELDAGWLNPKKAAALLVAGQYGVMIAVLWITYSSKGIPVLSNVLTSVFIVPALLQFLAGVGIFYKIEDSGDSYMSYLGWGAAGLVLIFFIIPMIGQMLLFWL